MAGKHVVEVYAQTPYGDYEKQNKVEKSAIQLVNYDKTDLLQPGASQTLEIPVRRYFLPATTPTVPRPTSSAQATTTCPSAAMLTTP